MQDDEDDEGEDDLEAEGDDDLEADAEGDEDEELDDEEPQDDDEDMVRILFLATWDVLLMCWDLSRISVRTTALCRMRLTRFCLNNLD
jgi:hypothetical protein